MSSEYSRNPTGLHGSVDIGSRIHAGARAAGASQAALDMGVDQQGLEQALQGLDKNRMGAPTVPPPRQHTLTADRFTTSGSLVNPKVA